MKMLTLEDREDRKEFERMWSENVTPVKLAAALDISLCTVYAELKRGQTTDGEGEVVLDENFRPAYSAERGAVYLQPQPPEPGTPPESGKKLKGAGEAGMKCKRCRYFYRMMAAEGGDNPLPCCHILEEAGKHPKPLTQECFEPRRKRRSNA